MEFTVPLTAAAEVERLRTALYQFQEVRNFTGPAAPEVRVVDGPAGLVRVPQIDTRETAEDFRLFWNRFRASRPARELRSF